MSVIGALKGTQVKPCTLKRMYLMYVLYLLKYWLIIITYLMGDTMLYSKTHVSIPWKLHIPSPHRSNCLVSDRTGDCTSRVTHPWRTPCDLFNFYVKKNIDLFQLFVMGLTYYIRMYLLITIKSHMLSSLRFGLLVNDASRGCTSQVMHP